MEIKCGLQALAILSILECLGVFYQIVMMFTYSGKEMTYWILYVLFLLPVLGNGYFQAKWFMKDTLKNRENLVLGYKIYIIAAPLATLWLLVGAFMLFGMSYYAWAIVGHPESLGRDSDGYCIDFTKCQRNTWLDFAKVEKLVNTTTIASTVVALVIQISLIYYFMSVAKRFQNLWV